MSSRTFVMLLGIVVLLGFGAAPGSHGVKIGLMSKALAQDQATPAGQGDGPGSLAAMLRSVPDVLAAATDVPPEEIDRTFPIVGYADIATQLAAFGGVAPTSPDDATSALWWRVVEGLAVVPDGMWPSRFVVHPDWRPTFGFDWLQVDQVVEIYWGPSAFLLLRGRFADDELRTAWSGSGYQSVTIDGSPVASYRADAEIDFDSPVGRSGLGALNNAAILDHGTVVFTSSLADMEAVLAVAAGRAQSLAAHPDVAALLDSAPDLVSALLLDGEGLKGRTAGELNQLAESGMGDYATAVAAAGTMPPVELALVGVTAGGRFLPRPDDADPRPLVSTEPARFFLALLMSDQAAAEAALPVVTERLATMPPFSKFPMTFADIFVDPRVSVAPTTPILVVDLGFGDTSATLWLAFVYSRDLGFVAW